MFFFQSKMNQLAWKIIWIWREDHPAYTMSCLSLMFLNFWTRKPLQPSKERHAGQICIFLWRSQRFFTWQNCQLHEHFLLSEFQNFKNTFWIWKRDPRQPKEHWFLMLRWKYLNLNLFSSETGGLFNECSLGILKNVYKIPAWKRLMDDPNLQKLFACPCWSKGLVQCENRLGNKDTLP